RRAAESDLADRAIRHRGPRPHRDRAVLPGEPADAQHPRDAAGSGEGLRKTLRGVRNDEQEILPGVLKQIPAWYRHEDLHAPDDAPVSLYCLRSVGIGGERGIRSPV